MFQSPEIARLAALCAARLHDAEAADSVVLHPDFRALLALIRELGPQFAFDREGRVGAIAAIRSALPTSERELLDAVIEDHACEIAAAHEAMFQVARACEARKK